MRRSFFAKWGVGILIGGIFAIFVLGGFAGIPLNGIYGVLFFFGLVMGHFALRDRDGSYLQLWRGVLELIGKRTPIVGLVHARGAQVCSYNDGPIRLSFGFAAWRRPDGELQRTYRAMDMRSSIFTAHLQAGKLLPYTVVEVQLLGDPESGTGKVWKISRKNVHDPELEAIATQLQEPIEISSTVAGTLRLDRKEDCFKRQLKWGLRTVELKLNCSDSREPQTVLGMADVLIRDQELWRERAERFAVEQLLESARGWAGEGASEVTEAEFLSRLSLQSISLEDTGDIDFLYVDGDLFGGHYIELSGKFSRGFDHAQLMG